MTAHIESKKEDIAPKVLMPGDPMRAKYIAENFLKDVVLVNDVRGMLGFTGTYKNERITVFASGMGMPSMGIYAYELCKFYGVKEIIRIGTSGAGRKGIHVKDLILGSSAYTLSTYPYVFFDDLEKEFSSSTELNDKILRSAQAKNFKIVEGTICTSDIFDPYVDHEKYFSKLPKDKDFVAFEMEAAALFAIGKHLNIKTSCLLTVVDSIYEEESLNSEEREVALGEMIVTALDAILQ